MNVTDEELSRIGYHIQHVQLSCVFRVMYRQMLHQVMSKSRVQAGRRRYCIACPDRQTDRQTIVTASDSAAFPWPSTSRPLLTSPHMELPTRSRHLCPRRILILLYFSLQPAFCRPVPNVGSPEDPGWFTPSLRTRPPWRWHPSIYTVIRPALVQIISRIFVSRSFQLISGRFKVQRSSKFKLLEVAAMLQNIVCHRPVYESGGRQI